jgi:hypothetical protein
MGQEVESKVNTDTADINDFHGLCHRCGKRTSFDRLRLGCQVCLPSPSSDLLSHARQGPMEPSQRRRLPFKTVDLSLRSRRQNGVGSVAAKASEFVLEMLLSLGGDIPSHCTRSTICEALSR